MNNPSIATKLKEIILSAKSELLKLTDAETFQKPRLDKWSKKEILGHLIDSAANNHQRFVRGQAKADMIFDGYDQVAWVQVQNYQSRSWEELVELWLAYNLQLAHVMQYMPEEICYRTISKHNLHKIAFKTVPENAATCLAYFMVDYVAHVEHHLKQILADYKTKLGPYENAFHRMA